MPGTILASVLEVADLPSIQGVCRGDRFFLKVSLGKMEFRTDNCEGDFSFPVSSLRDNLVITLHSAEGSEISRAVIKIVQVMENGFLESWFPLKGGGSAHMIFQFSLNEKDRKRIYEKRESAVRTKYTDPSNSCPMHSFSEGLLRPSNPNDAENLKESCSTSKGSNSIAADMATIIPEYLISGKDSAIFSSTEVGYASEKQNDLKRNSSSAIKKMSSSSETSLLQDDAPRLSMEPTEKSRLKKTESSDSIKEVRSDKGQLGSQTSYSETLAAETLANSISSGMLIEMGQEQTSGYVNSVPVNDVEDKSTSNNSDNPKTSMTRLNMVHATILHHEASMSVVIPDIKQTCLLWHPSFWKRRPCLTTAAEQIFYKLNGYDLFAIRPQTVIDLSTFKEHKMHGGPVDSASKYKERSRDSENPCPECILPVAKISKGLIKQGLKVILLVFACGTLILRTRAS